MATESSLDQMMRQPGSGGEVEAELKGHTNLVMSVAFSQDGSRVVFGSRDETVWIWNVMMGEVEAELKGHTDWVMCVAFSQDGRATKLSLD